METIEAKAFDNLKLVVELDFAWNKLQFVPLPQIRQLTLLRRLTMRGNPLYTLDEFTLSGGINGWPSQVAPVKAQTNNNPAESKESEEKEEKLTESGLNGATKRKLGRLFETYPKLARTIVRQRLQQLHLDENSMNENSLSVIIKGSKDGTRIFGGSDPEESLFDDLREFETLRSLIEQAEAAGGTSLLDKLGGGGTSEDDTSEEPEEEQLEVSPSGNDSDNDNKSRQLEEEFRTTFGAHFEQLQELDFGQCKLSYIKWNSFANLNQLKRLFLDGNHLR